MASTLRVKILKLRLLPCKMEFWFPEEPKDSLGGMILLGKQLMLHWLIVVCNYLPVLV
jgi:hypothetical protein